MSENLVEVAPTLVFQVQYRVTKGVNVAVKPNKQTHDVVPGRGVGSELNLLALTGEIGWKLALPLLVLMLIGIRLDRAYHTTPLFMLLGMALSLTTSIILIGRMIARISRHDRGSH